MSIIRKLYKDGFLDIQDSWITDTHYECIMGSAAYGVPSNKSDVDVHGFTTPPIEMVFPHLSGWIRGWDHAPKNFEHYQKHHINAYEKNYDVAIHSIVRMFDLAAENNPNILDMLWVPDNCITHIDTIGHNVRKNRRHFLHKGSYHRFRGYAHQQFKRLTNSPRKDLIEQYGYDTKFAYHIVRLALQVEQILEKGDMDFSEHSDFLKEVRVGRFDTVEALKDWYERKEKHLDELYASKNCAVPHSPDRVFLKNLLLACLELKYGSLEKIYAGVESDSFRKLEAIKQIVNS